MNSKIQIMDVTNKTFLFRNRDDIFLIGDIDIGYPVQLDFKFQQLVKNRNGVLIQHVYQSVDVRKRNMMTGIIVLISQVNPSP